MERRSKLKAREVVIKDFYGPDEHLYSDMLGWRTEDKKEARSFVSKDIFKYMIVDVGWNLAFYYVDGDTFYGIHTEWLPIEVKILPRDRAEPYIGLQCEGASTTTERSLLPSVVARISGTGCSSTASPWRIFWSVPISCP